MTTMFAVTYIINLPKSYARWHAMQPVLDAMGFPNRIQFPGVDGTVLDVAEIANLQDAGLLAADLSGFDEQCRAGEIGCALSHAAVMRDVVEKRWPAVLILEDDIALSGRPETWRRRCERAFADLPASWELWYLYRCFDIEHRIRRVTRRTIVPWTPQGGAAYAVSLVGAAKLAAALRPVASAVDRVYADLVKRRAIDAWAASPLLVLPSAQPSIINRENPEKKWVENGINRPPEYWPEHYLDHLGEVPPPKSAINKVRLAASRFLAGRRRA